MVYLLKILKLTFRFNRLMSQPDSPAKRERCSRRGLSPNQFRSTFTAVSGFALETSSSGFAIFVSSTAANSAFPLCLHSP
jgi:hypothetical protein